MRLCAVIVAGGRSSRMGQEKAFAVIRGRPIIERIIERLEASCDAILVNANGAPERFNVAGRPVIGDIRADIATPLAGLHAAISHAARHDFEAVVTVPSDAPFLPPDLVERLVAAQHRAAIASSGGHDHYLTGLWSSQLLPEIERALDMARVPRLQDWVRMCSAAHVTWPVELYDPFFNVNTPAELAEAQRIAAEFSL